MSFGNNSNSMVKLDQIQHGEETQYQTRPEDIIRQPKQYASQDQEETNTDIIITLRRKIAGKNRLLTKKTHHIKILIRERRSQIKIKFLKKFSFKLSQRC